MKRMILLLAMAAFVWSCEKPVVPDDPKDDDTTDESELPEELALSFSFKADSVALACFAGKEVARIERDCDWVEAWSQAEEGLCVSVTENPKYESDDRDEERPANLIYGHESFSRDAVLSVTLSDGRTCSVKVHQKAHPTVKISYNIVPVNEDMQPVGGISGSIWSLCLDEIELGENTEDVNFFIMPDKYRYLYGCGFDFDWERINEIFKDIIRSGGDEHVRVFNFDEYAGIMESHGGFFFFIDSRVYLVCAAVDDEGNSDTAIDVLTMDTPI